jgi:transposase-like protein
MKKNNKKRCIACCGNGYVIKLNPREKITLSIKRSVLKMYQDGYGIRETQRKLKIKSPMSVSYIIKTANVWNM